jgi:S1-C subfamily serine protease
VYAVSAGGPAANAGLQRGDLVLTIDGAAIPDSSTLIDIVAAHRPGDVVKLEIQRQDGSKATLSVTLAELPA